MGEHISFRASGEIYRAQQSSSIHRLRQNLRKIRRKRASTRKAVSWCPPPWRHASPGFAAGGLRVGANSSRKCPRCKDIPQFTEEALRPQMMAGFRVDRLGRNPGDARQSERSGRARCISSSIPIVLVGSTSTSSCGGTRWTGM
jgi:hypothetical protein